MNLRQLACGGPARSRDFSGFWASKMTFFKPARDKNLRVEGPPMVGWQRALFARMRSSLLQWSFYCQCSRSAAVGVRDQVPTNEVSEPHIFEVISPNYWVYENTVCIVLQDFHQPGYTNKIRGKWTSRKRRKPGNGNGNTESTAHALVYSLSSCLLRVCFCTCSVWYAATSVPGSRSLIRWLVRFAYSFTRCLATKTIIISSDLLRARMKTCYQSRSNGNELWTLIRMRWSGLCAIVYSLTELTFIALYSRVWFRETPPTGSSSR